MNISKTKDFISDQGEVFTGSRQELMKDKGIKHRKGFLRASGALDAYGDHWKELTDDVTFEKPKLFLNPKIYWDIDLQGMKVGEVVDESCTAVEYKMAKKGIHKDLGEEYCKEVEAKYDIIDNPIPAQLRGLKPTETADYWIMKEMGMI